jgi:dienelactone hydrolase
MTAQRFEDRTITFANGATGLHVDVPTANPSDYRHVIGSSASMPRMQIAAKLFLPPRAAGPFSAVICVPGSAGVQPALIGHAEALTDLGIAALVIDPFGARAVTSTVANQTQFSFAASAFDVLAAARVLAETSGIDPSRIGAEGHSRGGSAVMTAATERFAAAVGAPRLRAVYAAYPWCGHQFLDARVGQTRVRAVIGTRDEWCSPQQVQGCINAIRLTGGDVSFRLVPGAHHAFDRMHAPELEPNARVSPNAPTVYIADDGTMVDPCTGEPDPAATERSLMVQALKLGFGVTGAHMGTLEDQRALFRADMTAFWREAFTA